MTDRPPSNGDASCDFFGRYRLKLDAKGRLTLPSLHRRALGEETEPVFVLRPGNDAFIQMIPLHEWKALRQRREGLRELRGEELQWQQRTLYGGVEPATLDPKGRFLVPKGLAERCGMKGDVLVLGVGRILELWEPDRFFALEAEHRSPPSDVDDLLYG